MRLRRYWRLLRDVGRVARTIASQSGGDTLPSIYTPGRLKRTARRLHVERLRGRVIASRRETPDTRVIRIAFQRGSTPAYAPGQHFTVHAAVDAFETSRPYTATSPQRWSDVIELTVKRQPRGLVSTLLTEGLDVGDELEISGPTGDPCFNPLRDSEDLVFIAGGSGITHYMTTLEHVLDTRPGARILLLYGSRSQGDTIFHERLEALAARARDRFRMQLVLEQPKGRWDGEQGWIDSALIQRHVSRETLAGGTFFVTGPPPMNRAVRKSLGELGVNANRVRAAALALPPPDALVKIEGWPSGVRPEDVFTLRHGPLGEATQARAGEPLLQSLERAGARPRSECRTGHCGGCRKRLISGEVLTPPGYDLRPSDTEGDYIHPCVCFPLGDVTLRDA